MGHRQLALIFAVATAILALAYTALHLRLGFPPKISFLVLMVIYAGSSFLLLFIAKRKWELNYLNALIMLVSSSVVCALIFAAGTDFVYDNYHQAGYMVRPSFMLVFVLNFFIRLPIDAIVAIFRKR